MRFASKTLMVGVLTVALVIALSMIRGTVQDRQRHRAEAVEAVARSTAGAQSLEGPVLFVPFSDRVVTTQVDANGAQRRVEHVQHGKWVFFPQSLEVRGTLRSVPRMRGIHEVRVFELDSTQRAAFRVRIPLDDDPATPRTIGEPRLGLGISDVRGLVGVASLRVKGEQRTLRQGQGGGGSGLHTTFTRPAPGTTLEFDVEFKSSLQGTETLSIAPLAERNLLALESTWPHPQFHGDFLPRTRVIGPDGFRARWEVSSLASNAQSQFRERMGGSSAVPGIDAISVSLVDPVNIYSKVDRATKYGVLFVLLTFATFAMFEFLEQLRIHPIQYGLVGLAVAIFFLLLLALSEHIAFGRAYLIAAIACVMLIGHYLGHVLGGWVRGGGFAVLLGTLYAALYGLLISEDNAMVLGAGLLFLILAAIMVRTRKVDWYRAR
ncbi:MAG: cell envelope integrity protein CreD [Steroidobacteraceae bacterium]